MFASEDEVMPTIMVFIVGALVGNLFGMFLMGLLVASRDRDHAYRAYADKQSANEQRNPYTGQGIRSDTSKFPQETDIG